MTSPTLPIPMQPIARAIDLASRFVDGFEGDESQQAIEELQNALQHAIVLLERTGRVLDVVFGMTFTDIRLADGSWLTTVSDTQLSALRGACLTLRDGPSLAAPDEPESPSQGGHLHA